MISEKQLLRHGFLPLTRPDGSRLWMHGKVNGMLAGGVFHFPAIGEWRQAKNIGHLKHEFYKYTREKLVDAYGNDFKLILEVLGK